MSTWLESAQPGNKVELTGPLGSFYLRAVERPLLFLAGGTGLAPFLSMLEVLARANSQQKVHLIYGVTRDLDLVQVDAIDAYTAKLPNFSYATVVADADSNHPAKGWVTQHMPAEALNDGDVDVYLCGPPPMVDAVRKHFDDNGVMPNSFHYEKFTPNAAPRAA
jgi:benzoate/toluate 1,2-dioxygenase reductase subunit